MLRGWYYLGAVALGVLIQGVLAHTVNEIEDWRSGTDRHALAAGDLRRQQGDRGRAADAAGAQAGCSRPPSPLTTVLGLTLVAARGLVMLPFGLAGVGGAVLYTLPPVRAAYRPFVGEAIACVCLWLCVAGAAVLQGGRIDGDDVAGGAGGGRLRGGHADGAPLPRLRGRPLAANRPRAPRSCCWGSRGRRYAIGWCRSRWPPRWRRPCSRGWCRWWSATRRARVPPALPAGRCRIGNHLRAVASSSSASPARWCPRRCSCRRWPGRRWRRRRWWRWRCGWRCSPRETPAA